MDDTSALNNCQFCRSQLTFAAPSKPPDVRAVQGSQLVQGSRIEESFILLDDALAARRSQFAQEAGTTIQPITPAINHPTSGGAGRSMEESFMLVSSSTSALKPGSTTNAGRVALAPVFAALERICTVAADDTRVQQPLCLDCSDKVQRELESQVREVRAEVQRYEAALASLQADNARPLDDFEQQLAKAHAEEQAQR